MAKCLGVSPPVTTAPPSDADVAHNEEFLTALRDIPAIFPSADDVARRTRVVEELRSLLAEWLIRDGIAKGIPVDRARRRGTLALQGSVQLGLDMEGDDVDLVAVVAQHFTRADAFRALESDLRAHPAVAGLRAFREAAVPLLQFTLHGVPVDLKVARVLRRAVDPDTFDATNPKHLALVEDDVCMRSLSGTLIGAALLACVPDVATFRLVVKVVKVWARRRGIYGKAFGYFGGLAWTILVARVCQLYPSALPATALQMFFKVWAVWPFPTPVILTEIKDLQYGFAMWRPDRPAGQIAPVITPAYPSENCAGAVSACSLAAMRAEMRRALRLCRALPPPKGPTAPAPKPTAATSGPCGQATNIPTTPTSSQAPISAPSRPASPPCPGPSSAIGPTTADVPPAPAAPRNAPLPLNEILQLLDTKTMRPRYVVVSFTATHEHSLLRWKGFVQSRLTALVRLLVAVPEANPRIISHCRVSSPKTDADPPTEWSAEWLIGIAAVEVDLAHLTQEWVHGVLLTPDFPRPVDASIPEITCRPASEIWECESPSMH